MEPLILIHNYYIDFLKNLRENISYLFNDTIHSFEFNYGSKTIHQYNLYKNLDQEYPKCIINIIDIDSIDNSTFRNNNLTEGTQLYSKLCENFTKEELIAVSFRWVKLNYNIVLLFENGMDVLNYNDVLIQKYPKNFTYYEKEYKSFIDISDVANWDPKDNTENVFLRLTHTDNINHTLCYYNLEPRYKLNTINKMVDNNLMKFSITIDYEAELKIPNFIKLLKSSGIVEDIIVQIGLEQLTFDTPNPVLTVNNTFNKNNIINTLIIEKKDIVIVNAENTTEAPKYTIQIMDEYIELISGRSLGIWYNEQLIDMLPDDYNIVNETIKDNHGNSKTINKYIQFDIIKYPLIDVFLQELVNKDTFKDLYLFVYN